MLGSISKKLRHRGGLLAGTAIGVVLGAAVVGGAQLATATPPPVPTSACVHKYMGSIRVITGYSTACTWYEYQVELGSGPAGPTGATGPTGPTGPTGATGPQGAGGYYTVSDEIVNDVSVTGTVTVSCNGNDLAVYAEASSGSPQRVDFNTFTKSGSDGTTLTVYCIPEND